MRKLGFVGWTASSRNDTIMANTTTAAAAGCTLIDELRPPSLRDNACRPIAAIQAADGNRKRGARLGLAIVRAIAEAHGGSVAVRDRPGGGAVVELRLPREGPGHEPAGAAIAPAGAAIAPVNAAVNRRLSLPAHECPDGAAQPARGVGMPAGRLKAW